MPAVEDFGIPYGGYETGFVEFLPLFFDGVRSHLVQPFQKFYLSGIPTRNSPGRTNLDSREGGRQRSVKTSLSPKNPHNIAINSFDVFSRTPSCRNMQSLSSSSSNATYCMSMSAYTLLVIVVVKKTAPTIRHQLMAHHTPTLGM